MPGRLQDADYGAFVEWLRQCRTTRGMTQAALAERLKRPQSYVSKFERLERKLDVAEWREIASALGEDPTTAFAAVDKALNEGKDQTSV